jgi:hypothetical protein
MLIEHRFVETIASDDLDQCRGQLRDREPLRGCSLLQLFHCHRRKRESQARSNHRTRRRGRPRAREVGWCGFASRRATQTDPHLRTLHPQSAHGTTNCVGNFYSTQPLIEESWYPFERGCGNLLGFGHRSIPIKAPIGGRSEHPAWHRHMTWSRRSINRFKLEASVRCGGFRRLERACRVRRLANLLGGLLGGVLAITRLLDEHRRSLLTAGFLVTPDRVPPQVLAQSKTNTRNRSVESQSVIRPRARVARMSVRQVNGWPGMSGARCRRRVAYPQRRQAFARAPVPPLWRR